MCLLLTLTYRLIASHVPPLTYFSTINNISISVNRCNFDLVFFKTACHANPGEGKTSAQPNTKFQNTYSERC